MSHHADNDTTPAASSWMCRSDADLQRYYEALPAINRARRLVIAILLPSAALLTPWLGVPNVVLVLVTIVVGVLTDRLAIIWNTSVVAGVVVSLGFQLSLSVGVAITGGLQSPYQAWLAVPVTMLAARYRRTVVISAVGLAGALAGAAYLVADIADTGRDYPPAVRAVTTIALMCALVAIVLNLQSAELESRRAATTDPLTGVRNRKDLDVQLRHVVARVSRTGGALSVMLLDLDHFKQVNDVHGHATGDEVLRQAAQILTACLRPDDLVYRVGGEEFLVVLPLTDLQQAAAVAERVRRSVARRPVAGLPVTVSIGVASATRGELADPQGLQLAADAAMYVAKANGRDRVVLSGVDPEPAAASDCHVADERALEPGHRRLTPPRPAPTPDPPTPPDPTRPDPPSGTFPRTRPCSALMESDSQKVPKSGREWVGWRRGVGGSGLGQVDPHRAGSLRRLREHGVPRVRDGEQR